MENNAAYREARRQVERKLGFYTHLAIYLTVNTALVAFNLLAGHERTWSVFPLFGWGIGLLFHALAVFLASPKARWKQRMIERELNRN